MIQNLVNKSSQDNFRSAAFYGAGLGVFVLLSTILVSGHLLSYLHIGGFFVVVGGSLAAGLVQFSLKDIKDAFEVSKESILGDLSDPEERLHHLMDLGFAAKKDGVLVLEDAATQTNDSLLRLGLELVVDGRTEEDIRPLMERQITRRRSRAVNAALVVQSLSGYAPSMGLVGTLLGLIQMLERLKDPSTVGPSMALALVATLYGSVLANFILLPVAGRIRRVMDENQIISAVTLEGIFCLSRGESTVILEQRLRPFLNEKRAA